MTRAERTRSRKGAPETRRPRKLGRAKRKQKSRRIFATASSASGLSRLEMCFEAIEHFAIQRFVELSREEMAAVDQHIEVTDGERVRMRRSRIDIDFAEIRVLQTRPKRAVDHHGLKNDLVRVQRV